MSWWLDPVAWEDLRRELLGEAGERRLARLVWGESVDGRFGGSVGSGIEVRWGSDVDEVRVAELLELNGMPRWAAFEERFFVAERGGEVLGALRYRAEKDRLVLGMLVADPWAGERALAAALYAEAGELARELGVREVLVPAGSRGYPGEAGYRRWGRGWKLDVVPLAVRRADLPDGGWRRAFSLLGVAATPFFRAFVR